MAYSVTKCDVGGSTANGYHYEYLCESADDISDLPTGASSTEISRPAPGSLAYIESDSSARYILKISREWGEYPMAGGGGGTGGGVLVVNVDTENGVLDKTWQEIADAPIAVIKDSYELGDTSAIVLDTWIDDEKTEDAYQVTALRSQRGASPETLLYFCNGANEYPIVD